MSAGKRLNQYAVSFRVLGYLPAMFNGVDLNANSEAPDVGREFTIGWLDVNKTVAAEKAHRSYEARQQRRLELVAIKCIEARR